LAYESPIVDRAQSAGPQLYEALRRQILTAAIRPGAALPETRIAEQFGVSRTPVREVFHRLAEEGFLRIVPQVGTFVAPIRLDSVYDSQFVRETLECRAVVLAAGQATAADLDRLHDNLELQKRCIARKDHLGFFAADEAMHETIMAIAGHPNAWGLIAAAKTQLDRVRYLSLESADWLEMIFAQHRRIVEMIASRRPARVEGAMQDHLRTAFAAIERIARDHAEFFEGRLATRRAAARQSRQPQQPKRRRKTS
jgi:DNA-binding GntR family transcriptional regulator